ncbi:NAD(P)-binding protein [Venturia nashicola]|nr:NAD(P)-binding protein [Venturia nashicola]
MPHTLVTGANSYVAAHIIDALLSQGHRVTGSVRRQSAGSAILSSNPSWAAKLDFVEIKDYAKPGIWDDVFRARKFDYIFHVAAPLLDNPANVDYDEHFLRPSVEGNLSLLRSANEFAPTLKAIAMTGSINALTTGDDLPARILTNTSWNTITPQAARAANHPFISYCSSKKEAEIAVWEFIKTEKPSFTVTVFLPALIFGPPIQPVKDVKSLNFSAGTFYSLFSGENAGKPIPGTMFPSYVDVRDLADAHIKALTTPATANKRYLIGGFPYSNMAAVKVLAEHFPELKSKLPVGDEENVIVATVEAGEGNEVLGMTFKSFEQTVVDMTNKILEIEKRG